MSDERSAGSENVVDEAPQKVPGRSKDWTNSFSDGHRYLVAVDILLASCPNEYSEVVMPVATRMSPIPGLSGYVLVPLRKSADFTLYRGRKHDHPSSVLAIALFEQPSPQSIRRLMHEYSIAA